jgi:hypothetical protein
VEREIVLALTVAVLTGAVSSFGTVAALRVHITYLKDHIDKLYILNTRAHTRIDSIETAHRNTKSTNQRGN